MENTEKTLKAEVVKWENRLKIAKEADEKKFAQKKLDAAKSQLAEVTGGSAKKADEPKKPQGKKTVKSIAKTNLKTVEYKGKIYTEKDKEFCEILIKIFNERKAAIAKSNRKYKTTSVSSKVGRDVALAITTAIDNIPMKDIKSSPKTFLNKIEALEKAGNEFINAFKSILGEDYNKNEIKIEMAAIKELVDSIKSKYKK